MSDENRLNASQDELENGSEVIDESVVSDEVKTEDLPSQSSSDAEKPQNLEDELEQIRDTFQQELDKATAEAQAENGEETEDEAELKEDELCLCCGEKERMEGSDYCEDCYEAMRHYPFKWVYFLVAALAVYAAVLAIGKIGDINRGWVYAYEGDALSKAGWYTEASEKYQYAQNYLYRSKVEPKIVYLHSVENTYKIGGFQVINSFPTSVATLFEEWELKLPYMKNLKQYYMKAQTMSATIQTVNDEIFSKYSELPAEELPYDEIVRQIDDLYKRTLHIGIDENGNEIEESTTNASDFDGSMTSSDAVYFKRTTEYDKAMLEYFKYYFANTCKRPYEERVAFLEKVRSLDPDLVWLYASDLGIEYAENGEGEKAEELAEIITKNSETNLTAYYIRALIAKNIDHDYDEAIAQCDKGISYSPSAELYRQKALNYILKGDYEAAQESAQEAYDTSYDWSTVNTLAFCALANGDKEKFKEMDDIFTSYNDEAGEETATFSEAVKMLQSGKKTAEKILEEGDYDIYD